MSDVDGPNCETRVLAWGDRRPRLLGNLQVCLLVLHKHCHNHHHGQEQGGSTGWPVQAGQANQWSLGSQLCVSRVSGKVSAIFIIMTIVFLGCTLHKCFKHNIICSKLSNMHFDDHADHPANENHARITRFSTSIGEISMNVMLTHLLIFASLLCQKKIEILSLLFIERLPCFYIFINKIQFKNFHVTVKTRKS